MVAFAVFFGLAGIVQDGEGSFDWVGAIMVDTFSVLICGLGLALITARASFAQSGFDYRYGVIRRRVPVAEIESITVGFGSGAGYPRICLHIHQRGRSRPIRLTALQRPDSAKGRAALEQTAQDVRTVLGLS